MMYLTVKQEVKQLAKAGKYPFKSVKLPKYLPKDGFTTLIIGFVRFL